MSANSINIADITTTTDTIPESNRRHRRHNHAKTRSHSHKKQGYVSQLEQFTNTTAIIEKSSKFLKNRDQFYKRNNPCQDDETYAMLAASLRTQSIKFTQLFRYATLLDYILMCFGAASSFVAAWFYVLTIHYLGVFYEFFHQRNSCFHNLDGSTSEFPFPYFWYCLALIVFAFFHNMLFRVAAMRQIKRLHVAYVESIARKDSTWFHSYIDRDLPFRVTRDMQEIRLGLGESIGKLIFHSTTSLLILPSAINVSLTATLIASFVVPLFTIASLLKVRSDARLKTEENLAYQPANTVAAQMLSKVRMIRIFCGEAKAVSAYKKALYSPWCLRKRIILTSFWAGLCWLVPMSVHPLLLWLALDYLESSDKATLDFHKNPNASHCIPLPWKQPHVPLVVRLDTVLLYMTFAVYFISNIPPVYQRVKRALLVAAEVYFYIDWKPGIDNISNQGHIPRSKVIGEIVMTAVTFNYPSRPRTEVLTGVNLIVHPGQMVTIFGPSKCGKTTILKLLLRKYDFCEGSIRLDSTDLYTLNVPWLRSQIGFVPQRPVFLNGTIQDNLCGPLKPSMESIMLACKKAGFFSDIMALEKGLKTVVGSKSSVRLTPLQMKKFCLARVFLRQCRIILLDEFFANMDEYNEGLFLELFESMRDSISLILTSRKMNGLMKASDIIYVMKEGQIVQVGNHENISKVGGVYMDLLEETLKEEKVTAETRIKTDSQLIYYKFADAIRRIHDIHDQEKNIDYSKLQKNEKARKSILLRHNAPKQDRLIPSRLVGGYYKFVSFEAPIDTYYERSLLRNHLVHGRDLTAKILPDPEPDGYPGIQEKLRKLPMNAENERSSFLEDNLDEGEDGEISSEAQVALKSPIVSESSESETTFKMEEFAAENMIDMLVDSSKKKAQGNHWKESFGKLTERMELQKLKSMEARRSGVVEWKASGVARLQHYFGWPINSPVDKQSISSEDSFLFWADYSQRLQLSNKRRRDAITTKDFLKLAKHSWPYLVFSFLTSVQMGLALVFSVTETAHVYVVYLHNSEHRRSIVHHVPHIVNCAAFASLGALVQELVLGFGLCAANNKFRASHFATIMEQDIRWFGNPRHDIQYLCDYLASDIATVNTALVAMVTIYTESFVIITTVVIVVVVDAENLWKESLSLLLIIPFLIMINYLQGHNRKIKLSPDPTKSESLLYDMISNIDEVISQGLSGHILRQYKEYEFGTTKKKTLRNRLHKVWEVVRKNLIFALSRASFFLSFAIWNMVCQGQKNYTPEEAGYFIIVTYLMLYGFFPMGFALAGVPSPQEHADSASFILETEKIKGMYNFLMQRLDLGPDDPPPSITFENVSWFDEEGNMTLEDVNFGVASGHYVAIVGAQSATKNALLGLLFKYLEPEEGRILMNATSYVELEGRNVKQIIAKVTQDPDLFSSLSIAENIAYGDNFREVSEEEIVAAGKLALIHALVEELPEKYATKLRDLPVKPETFAFRQRIAVARAAVRNPKVVVVDEMTVSVDEESDWLLMKALMNLRQGRTFIVISQRIQPIRRANSILVFDKGSIAEMGTDRDLLSKKGLYYEIYMMQQLYERGVDNTGDTTDSVSSSNTSYNSAFNI